VLREVFAAYVAFRDGVEGGPQLARVNPTTIHRVLRTQDLTEAEQFFREKLKDSAHPLRFQPLPPAMENIWGVAQSRLSEELTSKLSAFARTAGVTVNTLLPGSVGPGLTSSQRRARHRFWRNPCRTRVYIE